MYKRIFNLTIILILSGPVMFSMFTNCGNNEFGFESKVFQFGADKEINQRSQFLKVIDGDIVLDDIIIEESSVEDDGNYYLNVVQPKNQEAVLSEKIQNGDMSEKLQYMLWPEGEVAYKWSDSVDEDTQSKLKPVFQSFNELMADKNLKIEIVESDEDDAIRLFFVENSKCRSTLGYSALKPKIVFSSNCLDEKSVVHLFMHALGFGHKPDTEQDSLMARSIAETKEDSVSESKVKNEESRSLVFPENDFKTLQKVYGLTSEKVEYNPFELDKVVENIEEESEDQVEQGETVDKNPIEEVVEKAPVNTPKEPAEAPTPIKTPVSDSTEKPSADSDSANEGIENGNSEPSPIEEVKVEPKKIEKAEELPKYCEDIQTEKKYTYRGVERIVKSLTGSGYSKSSMRFDNNKVAYCDRKDYEQAKTKPTFCDQIKKGEQFQYSGLLMTVKDIVLNGAWSYYLVNEGKSVKCNVRPTQEAPALPDYCEEVKVGQKYTLPSLLVDTVKSIPDNKKLALIEFNGKGRDTCVNKSFMETDSVPTYCEDIKIGRKYRINQNDLAEATKLSLIGKSSNVYFGKIKLKCTYKEFDSVPEAPEFCEDFKPGLEFRDRNSISKVKSITLSNYEASQYILETGSKGYCKNRKFAKATDTPKFCDLVKIGQMYKAYGALFQATELVLNGSRSFYKTKSSKNIKCEIRPTSAAPAFPKYCEDIKVGQTYTQTNRVIDKVKSIEKNKKRAMVEFNKGSKGYCESKSFDTMKKLPTYCEDIKVGEIYPINASEAKSVTKIDKLGKKSKVYFGTRVLYCTYKGFSSIPEAPEFCEDFKPGLEFRDRNSISKVKTITLSNHEASQYVLETGSKGYCKNRKFAKAADTPKFCDLVEIGKEYKAYGTLFKATELVLNGSRSYYKTEASRNIRCVIRPTSAAPAFPKYCEDIKVGQTYTQTNRTIDKVKSIEKNKKRAVVEFEKGSKSSCESKSFATMKKLPVFCEDIKIGETYPINSYEAKAVTKIDRTGKTSKVHFGTRSLSCTYKGFNSLPLAPKYCEDIKPGLEFRNVNSISKIKSITVTNTENSLYITDRGSKGYCKNKKYETAQDLPKFCDLVKVGSSYKVYGQITEVTKLSLNGGSSFVFTKSNRQVRCDVRPTAAAPIFPKYCEDINMGQMYTQSNRIIDKVKSIEKNKRRAQVHFIKGSKSYCESKSFASLKKQPTHCEDVKVGTIYPINSLEARAVTKVQIFAHKSYVHYGNIKTNCIYRGFSSLVELPKVCEDIKVGQRYKQRSSVYTVQGITSKSSTLSIVKLNDSHTVTCTKKTTSNVGGTKKIWYKSKPPALSDNRSMSQFQFALSGDGSWVKKNSSNQYLISFEYRDGSSFNTIPASLLYATTLGGSGTSNLMRGRFVAQGVDGKKYYSDYHQWRFTGSKSTPVKPKPDVNTGEKKIWYKSKPPALSDNRSMSQFQFALSGDGSWVKKNSSNQYLISFEYRDGSSFNTIPASLLYATTLGGSGTSNLMRGRFVAQGVDGKKYYSDYHQWRFTGSKSTPVKPKPDVNTGEKKIWFKSTPQKVTTNNGLNEFEFGLSGDGSWVKDLGGNRPSVNLKVYSGSGVVDNNPASILNAVKYVPKDSRPMSMRARFVADGKDGKKYYSDYYSWTIKAAKVETKYERLPKECDDIKIGKKYTHSYGSDVYTVQEVDLFSKYSPRVTYKDSTRRATCSNAAKFRGVDDFPRYCKDVKVNKIYEYRNKLAKVSSVKDEEIHFTIGKSSLKDRCSLTTEEKNKKKAAEQKYPSMTTKLCINRPRLFDRFVSGSKVYQYLRYDSRDQKLFFRGVDKGWETKTVNCKYADFNSYSSIPSKCESVKVGKTYSIKDYKGQSMSIKITSKPDKYYALSKGRVRYRYVKSGKSDSFMCQTYVNELPRIQNRNSCSKLQGGKVYWSGGSSVIKVVSVNKSAKTFNMGSLQSDGTLRGVRTVKCY